MKNTGLSVKNSTSEMLDWDNGDIILENQNKIIILYWFRSLSTVLSPTVNNRIQWLFKAFEWFSSTFQGRFKFQGLFKKAL